MAEDRSALQGGGFAPEAAPSPPVSPPNKERLPVRPAQERRGALARPGPHSSSRRTAGPTSGLPRAGGALAEEPAGRHSPVLVVLVEVLV